MGDELEVSAQPDAPTTFISYSHDSPQHKKWVATLAGKLREFGVDAKLDQWDLRPGGDVETFMEKGVAESERVVVVCTPEYVRKADAGIGGVGYEKMIITTELIRDLGTTKFVPVIRAGTEGVNLTPRCLGSRKYVDFRVDGYFESAIEELTRAIHLVPADGKPPLGRNPFPAGARVGADGDRSFQRGASVALPSELDDPVRAYALAVELIRNNDKIGWRQLRKRMRGKVELLREWRKRFEGAPPSGKPARQSAVDQAVASTSPLMAFALAGVESGNAEFSDQRYVVDDILNLGNWNRGGCQFVTEIPGAVCFVFQALYAAVAISTGQVDTALSLATMPIVRAGGSATGPLWRASEIVGWVTTLGGDCFDSWRYATGAHSRWPWLAEIISTEAEYRISLVAYYMLLNLYEFVTFAGSPGDPPEPSKVRLEIPLAMLLESEDVVRRAIGVILRYETQVRRVWESQALTLSRLRGAWPLWMQICGNWLQGFRPAFYHDSHLREFASLLDRFS